MNEAISNVPSCAAAVANGANGTTAMVCGTVLILGGLILVGVLVLNGHAVKYSGRYGTLEVA